MEKGGSEARETSGLGRFVEAEVEGEWRWIVA